MAQYDPITIKSGILSSLDSDTLRADKIAAGGLTLASWLVAGDVCQISDNLTITQAYNINSSPIVGVYDGVSGSIIREGVVTARFAVGPTTVGEAVYLSENNGKLTNVKPTKDMLHEVGVVVDVAAKKILLQPKPVIALPPSTLFLGKQGVNNSEEYAIPSFSLLGSFATTGFGPYRALWDGNYVWFADSANPQKVVKVDPATRTVVGGPWTLAGSGTTNAQNNFAFDGTNYWIAAGSQNYIVKFDVNGNVITTVTGMTGCYYLSYDGNGNILVSCSGATARVYKVSIASNSIVGTWTHSGTAGIGGGGCVVGGYFWQLVSMGGLPADFWWAQILISDMSEVAWFNSTWHNGSWSYFDGKYIWSAMDLNIVKQSAETGLPLANWYRGAAGAFWAISDGLYLWTGATSSVARINRETDAYAAWAPQYPYCACITKRILPWPVN